MAIDTRDKRASVLGFGLASLLILPAPGVLDQGDRQQLAYAYRGIQASAPIPATPTEVVTVPDEILTISVPAEPRTVEVAADVRVVSVATESRIVAVAAEDRIVRVPAPSRIVTL